MAFIKDYYTESGQHFIQVTPQEKGWIPYQAAMICVQKPEWLPPCERHKDEKMFEAMEYFKIIDFETKKQLSLEIIDYIRKCKNKFQ